MQFDSTVLFVKDINRAKQFYIKLLQQKIAHDFGTNIKFHSQLSIWQIQDEHLIKQKLKTEQKANKTELYFEDENLEATEILLKKNNIQFLHETREEPWGQKTLRFFDPDHHLIEIGEPLHIFIKRMKKDGMVNKDIEQKTGVPESAIEKLLKHP